MRVVVSSTGGVGHVTLVPLVQAMRDRGDDVLVVDARPGVARVRAAGIPVVEAGLEARVAQAELAARWPEVVTIPGPEKPTFVFPRLFGAIAAPRLHPVLPSPVAAHVHMPARTANSIEHEFAARCR